MKKSELREIIREEMELAETSFDKKDFRDKLDNSIDYIGIHLGDAFKQFAKYSTTFKGDKKTWNKVMKAYKEINKQATILRKIGHTLEGEK